MQVILHEDVVNLGKAGDIVNVRDGYGRNFLLPKGKAKPANPKNLKELEHNKRIVVAKQKKAKTAAEDLAKKISALSITISREVGEDDKLFGSVTSKDIVDAVRVEGIHLDRHVLSLEHPIKQLGIFDVPVKLHAEVAANVKVWVVKK